MGFSGFVINDKPFSLNFDHFLGLYLSHNLANFGFLLIKSFHFVEVNKTFSGNSCFFAYCYISLGYMTSPSSEMKLSGNSSCKICISDWS